MIEWGFKGTSDKSGEHVDGKYKYKGKYYTVGEYQIEVEKKDDKKKEKDRRRFLKALSLEKL